MGALIKVTRAADGVATVTLGRVAKRNALNSELMLEMQTAFKDLTDWEDLRVVVLTGADASAFIGGADVVEMSRLDAASARVFIGHVHQCCRAVIDCPVPVIARIEGYALGAGLEIAAACDLRIAAHGARFGMPEVRLGMPSVVEAALLPRLVGAGRARWLVYTGELIDAQCALQWGLVEEVMEPGELGAATQRLTQSLLAAAPGALRAQKRLCVAWDEVSLAQSIERSVDAFTQAWESPEPRERLALLMQRRADQRRSGS